MIKPRVEKLDYSPIKIFVLNYKYCLLKYKYKFIINFNTI